MNDRIILITGANGGLGQAIAQAFLEESPATFVWLGVHQNRERAEKMITEYESRCSLIEIDVTDPVSWKSAVQEISTRSRRLDVLVNNAGRAEDGLLAMMPIGAWDNVIAENLKGTFLGCQAILPQMIAQRHGRIVNMSSLSALLPPPGQANYAAAKAGVIALTQSLAKEVARTGVTVNAICPGYIDTPALGQMSEDAKAGALAKIPMRRFGKPTEVAAAVRFLASQDAAYITGSVLKIDGGIL